MGKALRVLFVIFAAVTMFGTAAVQANALDDNGWQVKAGVRDNDFGYVKSLSVKVVNSASYDFGEVQQVEVSEDQINWQTYPYTEDVLAFAFSGVDGDKVAFVRFLASDGTYSPLVRVTTVVDTKKPATYALNRVSVRRGHYVQFKFNVKDATSVASFPRIIVRNSKGEVIAKTGLFGLVATNQTTTVRILVNMHPGRYTWSVRARDLAGWYQGSRTSRSLVVLK